MYGLKQAALLAHNKLVQHLAPHGYRPVPHSLGLWTHDTRPTSFCLCVDDFGIKYFTKNDANHLLDILKNLSKSLQTGKEKKIVVSQSIGTTMTTMLISPCQATSIESYIDSNIQNLLNHNMLHTHGQRLCMARAHSMLENQINHHHLTASE